jgi:hypothetical protein
VNVKCELDALSGRDEQRREMSRFEHGRERRVTGLGDGRRAEHDGGDDDGHDCADDQA